MNRKLLWLLSLTLLSISLSYITQAQNNGTRSPYSRYALGELSDISSVSTKAMGNVGIGVRSSSIINNINPASYTSVDSMTFMLDMGLYAGYSFLKYKDKNDSQLLGNLEYISMLFPLTKYLGISAGLHNLSRRGYLFGSTQNNEGEVSNPSTYSSVFTGSGNLSEVYVGLGGFVYNGLSLGVNVNYVMGNTSRWRQINFNSTDSYNPTFRVDESLFGLKLDFGIQYQYNWGYENESYWIIGATFSPKSYLNSSMTDVAFVSNNSSGVSSLNVSDRASTVSYKTNLPLSFGLGGSIDIKNKLLFALDVNYQKWSDVLIKDLVETKDVIGWSIGTEWIPSSRSRSLLEQSKYRLGLTGSNSYFSFPINNKQESFYNLGASVGMGIPLVDRRSNVNISFEYKYRMPSSDAMIKEHYVGMSLGITFNGNWFRKIKID